MNFIDDKIFFLFIIPFLIAFVRLIVKKKFKIAAYIFVCMIGTLCVALVPCIIRPFIASKYIFANTTISILTYVIMILWLSIIALFVWLKFLPKRDETLLIVAILTVSCVNCGVIALNLLKEVLSMTS